MKLVIGTDEFLKKGKELIRDYHNTRIGDYEQKPIATDDVYSVINYCILGDLQGMFITTNPDGAYYRVSYINEIDMFIFEYYEKFYSIKLPYNSDANEEAIEEAINCLYEIEHINELDNITIKRNSYTSIWDKRLKINLEIYHNNEIYFIELTGEKEIDVTLFYFDFYKMVYTFEQKLEEEEKENKNGSNNGNKQI